MRIIGISGSPSPRSRSGWLLQLALTRLEGRARSSAQIAVRELPAAPLLAAHARTEAIQAALREVAEADLVIVATPIYKAAYSGLLKLFLDLLPTDALRGKTVLPLATGGTVAHLLAIDYALKPVLSALGARDILDGVFATDTQLVPHDAGGYVPHDDLVERLDRALQPLTESLRLPWGARPCAGAPAVPAHDAAEAVAMADPVQQRVSREPGGEMSTGSPRELPVSIDPWRTSV